MEVKEETTVETADYQTPVGEPNTATEQNAPNFDDWERDEIFAYQESGAVPERFAEKKEPEVEPVKETVSEEENTDATAEDVKEGEAEESATAEKVEETAEFDVDNFEFTDTDDAEVFEAEAEKYLASVELPKPLETILNRYKETAEKTAAELAPYQALGDTESLARTVNAMNKLVEWKQTEHGFVPDTGEFLKLLDTDFKNEKDQIFIDGLARASEKYAGLTKMQEIIKENFGLSDEGMQNLDELLKGGGRPVTPNFVPDGIHKDVAEAFWLSPRRDEILSDVEYQLNIYYNEHSSEAEKNAAIAEIKKINQELVPVQNGYNSERQKKEDAQKQTETQKTTHFDSVNTAVVEKIGTLRTSLADRIAASMDFLGDGAGLVADTFTVMIEKALSDDRQEAQSAQTQLKKRGISYNWQTGKDLIDRLWASEDKLQTQLADERTNPRAIDITRREQSEILREMQKEEKEILGQITRTVSKGASRSLEQKIKDAPKVKAVKAKVAATPKQGAKADYDSQSREELLKTPAVQAAYGGNPYRKELFGE